MRHAAWFCPSSPCRYRQHLHAIPCADTLRIPLTHQEEVMTMIVVAAASAGSTRV